MDGGDVGAVLFVPRPSVVAAEAANGGRVANDVDTNPCEVAVTAHHSAPFQLTPSKPEGPPPGRPAARYRRRPVGGPSSSSVPPSLAGSPFSPATSPKPHPTPDSHVSVSPPVLVTDSTASSPYGTGMDAPITPVSTLSRSTMSSRASTCNSPFAINTDVHAWAGDSLSFSVTLASPFHPATTPSSPSVRAAGAASRTPVALSPGGRRAQHLQPQPASPRSPLSRVLPPRTPGRTSAGSCGGTPRQVPVSKSVSPSATPPPSGSPSHLTNGKAASDDDDAAAASAPSHAVLPQFNAVTPGTEDVSALDPPAPRTDPRAMPAATDTAARRLSVTPPPPSSPLMLSPSASPSDALASTRRPRRRRRAPRATPLAVTPSGAPSVGNGPSSAPLRGGRSGRRVAFGEAVAGSGAGRSPRVASTNMVAATAAAQSITGNPLWARLRSQPHGGRPQVPSRPSTARGANSSARRRPGSARPTSHRRVRVRGSSSHGDVASGLVVVRGSSGQGAGLLSHLTVHGESAASPRNNRQPVATGARMSPVVGNAWFSDRRGRGRPVTGAPQGHLVRWDGDGGVRRRRSVSPRRTPAADPSSHRRPRVRLPVAVSRGGVRVSTAAGRRR